MKNKLTTSRKYIAGTTGKSKKKQKRNNEDDGETRHKASS